MKKTLIIMGMIFLAHVAFADKGGGASISFGYQLNDATAAKETYEAMIPDEELSSTNELVLDIHGWGVLNRFLRIGGILSGGYFDAKGEPSEDVMSEDESGVGFGDARLAVLPEVYATFGPLDLSGGLAVGGGSIITFINDDNGDNDGEMSFYGFIRPQVSAAYDLGPVGVELTTGYHMPFAGDEGKFWFIEADGDTVEKTFEPSEMGGIFFELGVFFGDKGVKE
ncbi:hypothetical protein KAH81_04305 [bacterium]|nr:hypothetical protein [bacterium]